MFSKKLWISLLAVFGIFFAVFLAGYFVAMNYSNQINLFLNARTQIVIPEEGAKIYYFTDYESQEKLVEYEHELCRTIEAEGAALLKNDNNALPLTKGNKVSLFSQSSFSPLYGGTGSGHVSAGDAVSFKAAIEGELGAGTVNTELWKMYATSGYKRVNADTTGGHQGQYRINEVPWSRYSDKVKNSFSSFGDAAIVVLARSGGEGADLPSSHAGLTQYMTDGDYLRLCKEEEDMMSNIKKYKDEGVFKKVIVLLNSANALQIDFLDKYSVDSVLWIGDLGMTGVEGVAQILSGDVVPSGRIVDTFLKDNHSAPAMNNFGAFDYVNADEYELETAQNNTDAGVAKANRNFVVYAEGIYVGYRYFETRYEDYVLGRGNAGDFDYASCVAYPFGSGLSYTTFEYSDFSVVPDEDKFIAEVNVKNTGRRDAKHTVQIYFQSPYTDYDRQNAVEKAAVEICGFDKKTVRAGATEKYRIEIEKSDLKSYDYINAKTYIMDAGDYYFTVGTDAHNAINNILMAKNANTSRMTGTGNAALTAKWSLAERDTTTYSKSAVTGKEITNLFDDANPNFYEGTSGQNVTFLTRSNWVGTYPEKYRNFRVTEKMWADGLTHREDGRKAIVESMKAKYYPDVTEVPPIGLDKGLKVADFIEIADTNPSWMELIQQVSYKDLTNLIYNGFHLTQAIVSIGLPATYDENGPQGFTKSLVGGGSAMAYTSEDVMAATFNLEIARSIGKCIGEDFMHATEPGAPQVYAGIYGPGANIHRTAYSGRNFEYYSEDGWLSGKICEAEVAGIQSKGVYVFTKHFALNDQEEGRYGISTWANEQSIREIYLKGFEGSVKGGGLGVMSSFNRLGVVWAGGHYGLMTGILRDEWGMKGAAITDCSYSAKYMDYRFGVLAGQDLWDGGSSGMATLDGLDGDAAIVACCQRAGMRICYSISRSHAMNIGNATIRLVTPWWQVLLIVLNIVFGLAMAGSAVMLVLSIRKKK